jgi:endoglucanase
VRGVAEGTGSRQAIVILEPDSLGLLERMANSEERIQTLRNAVAILAEHENIRAYVDGTHSAWVPAPEMAERLRKIGIEKVRGVALNGRRPRSWCRRPRGAFGVAQRAAGGPEAVIVGLR